MEGDAVRIRKSSVALAEAQQLAASHAGGRKLVDELLDERSEETRRE
jgi:hypothetical protein